MKRAYCLMFITFFQQHVSSIRSLKSKLLLYRIAMIWQTPTGNENIISIMAIH